MPKLNDHGLGGGGGKALGVPVYPFETVDGYVAHAAGALVAVKGEQIERIPDGSYSNSGCAIGDEIYLMGMRSYDVRCYKYNVKTKVWTRLTDSPYTGLKPWAVPHGTDIYYGCAGTANVYKYDTLSDTHTLAISGTGHRMDYSRATIDGDYIYIFGGNYSTTYRTYATRVNITDGTYTRLKAIPYETYNQCVISGGDGYIYIFGGQVNSTAAYKYSIADNTYTAVSESPMGCYGTMIGRSDNLIYLINSAHSLYIKSIYVYDILTDTYTALGSTANGRQYGIVGIIDDVIYTVGGGTSSTTYVTGDTLMILRATGVKLSIQKLCKGLKLYTDGEVNSGSLKDFNGPTVFERENILEKENGTVTIPLDGDYALITATYATIGG